MVIYMQNHIKVMLHVSWMRIFRLNNNFLRLFRRHFNRSLQFYCVLRIWLFWLSHTACTRVGNGSCGNSLLRESYKRELNRCSVLQKKNTMKNKKEKYMCVHYIHFNGWDSMDTYFPYCVYKYKMWINNQQQQQQ